MVGKVLLCLRFQFLIILFATFAFSIFNHTFRYNYFEYFKVWLLLLVIINNNLIAKRSLTKIFECTPLNIQDK
jgi:hypothetical protein